MTKLSLYFVQDELPELCEAAFSHPLLGDAQRRCARGKSAGAYSGYSSFQWTKAVQGLCVLFLRGKIKKVMGQGTFNFPELVGEAQSLAASLDYALDKQTPWLLDMFGWDKNGTSLARRAILRTNPGRKRKGPVALSLNDNFLSGQDVEIYIGSKEVKDIGTLEALCQKIYQLDAGEISKMEQRELAVAC